MEEKKFSIVMPFKSISKDSKEFLSALGKNKSINNFELIFVFSDDNLKIEEVTGVIKNFIKQDIVVLKDTQSNSGPSRCWCLGLKAAKGRFVCFIATDLIPAENWCLSILKNINFKTDKKFWIGNIFNSYKRGEHHFLERIEMQIDERRYKELIVDFRNFVGEKKVLVNIINDYFNGRYCTDVELDFILKNILKLRPSTLDDLIVYNKYPQSFIESVNRKFKHGVGDGRISKMFVDKFRRVPTFGFYDFYLGVLILFNETKKAKLLFFDRLVLVLFNIIFLIGMLFGIIMPRYFIKKYYTFHFDEK